MNRLPGLVQCKYNNFISKIINKESFIMWYYSIKVRKLLFLSLHLETKKKTCNRILSAIASLFIFHQKISANIN